MSDADPFLERSFLERIAAFSRDHGAGIEIRKAGRGYTLRSQPSGAPIARLQPTGTGDHVRVLAWRGSTWGPSGPLGVITLPLDEALLYILEEPFFWIYAR